jgi:hypothetical protein
MERRAEAVKADPDLYGYMLQEHGSKFGAHRGLEMLKTAFCLVLASWMTGCIMMIVYSREIAEFMIERMQ